MRKDALLLPILGQEKDTFAKRRLRLIKLRKSSVQLNPGARGDPPQAVDGLAQFRAPRAEHAREADNFSRGNGKIDITEVRQAGKALDLQDWSGGFALSSSQALGSA